MANATTGTGTGDKIVASTLDKAAVTALVKNKDQVAAISKAAHLDKETQALIKQAAAGVAITAEVMDAYRKAGINEENEKTQMDRVKSLETFAHAAHAVGRRSIEQAITTGTLLRMAKDVIQHGNWEFWLDRAGFVKDAAQRLMAESLAVEKFPELADVANKIGGTNLSKIGRAGTLKALTQDKVNEFVEYIEDADDAAQVSQAMNKLLGKESTVESVPELPFDQGDATDTIEGWESLVRNLPTLNQNLADTVDMNAVHKHVAFRKWVKECQGTPTNNLQLQIGKLIVSAFMLDVRYQNVAEVIDAEATDDNGDDDDNGDLFTDDENPTDGKEMADIAARGE